MKKIYTAFLFVCAFTVGNAQKVYFKQTFDKPNFSGTTNFLTSGDYYGPPTTSIYNQIASSCDYSSPTPDNTQFTFIGTGAAGVDSLVSDGNGGYALQLQKTSGSSNSCTIVRSVSVSPDSTPKFLVINFDITPSDFSASKVANSFYCTVGHLLDTLRSESTTTGLATRLAISPNGGATNIFRLRDPGTPTALGIDSFTTGSKYTVTFILNGGDSTIYHTYLAPDGSVDSVTGAHWDAWIKTSSGTITKELSARRVANPANPLQGFRFLVTNGPQVSYILDNVIVTDGGIPTLPVNLSKFDAAKINATTASISWTVANATNVKQFEVTKSMNGSNFKTIGTVSYSGIKRYSYNDTHLDAGTTSYYRLSSIDKNGLIHYSNVVTVVNKAGNISSLTLAPNLIRNTATLNINATKQDYLTISVFDMIGRSVLQKGINITEGNNKSNLDFSALKAGSYFLKTISSDGSALTSRFEKL